MPFESFLLLVFSLSRLDMSTSIPQGILAPALIQKSLPISKKPPRSVHPETEHLVRAIRRNRILAVLQALVDFEAVEVVAHPFDREPEGPRNLLLLAAK